MSEIYDGGAAFPCNALESRNGDIIIYATAGMSLRDYFAAKAPSPPDWWLNDLPDSAKCQLAQIANALSEWNYIYADAMLKAREE